MVKETIPTDPSYGQIASLIFKLNDSRYRLKCIINKLSSASIQEQKGYAISQVDYVLNDTDTIDIKHLTVLSLKYDKVNILCSETMKKAFIHDVPEFNYSFQVS
jgi:hypothetical protein